jgi:hypothetical protein
MSTQRSTPGAQWNKELNAEAVSRATKEYLATLDDAAFGAASDVTPKFVSPSDPAAQWTGAMRGPASPWQELSDVSAALVGYGHVSGLFVRPLRYSI